MKRKTYTPLIRDIKIATICDSIRESRRISGMSQSELAKKINKKRTAISKIENEPSNITLKTLFDIIEGGLGLELDIKIKRNENCLLNVLNKVDESK